jgi:hypothetical protein
MAAALSPGARPRAFTALTPVRVQRLAVVLGERTPYAGGLLAGHAQLQLEALVLHRAPGAQAPRQFPIGGVDAGELRRLALVERPHAPAVARHDPAEHVQRDPTKAIQPPGDADQLQFVEGGHGAPPSSRRSTAVGTTSRE